MNRNGWYSSQSITVIKTKQKILAITAIIFLLLYIHSIYSFLFSLLCCCAYKQPHWYLKDSNKNNPSINFSKFAYFILAGIVYKRIKVWTSLFYNSMNIFIEDNDKQYKSNHFSYFLGGLCSTAHFTRTGGEILARARIVYVDKRTKK